MSKLEFKELSLDDLRKDYNTRLGFVFKSKSQPSDGSIENLCNVLINFGVAREFPEFVVRVNECTVFIYGDDFDSPLFFQRADMAAIFHRSYQVESLINALK